MPQLLSTLLTVIGFLADHKDDIKKLVVTIESLIPDAPGAVKAAQVKAFIASGLGIEAQIESVWPLLSPVFNAFVALAKGKTPA